MKGTILRNPWWRRASLVPAAASVAAICYLALKPSPSIQNVPLMPRALGRWFEQEDFFCNVSGFFVLTVVIHATFARWRREAAGAVAWRALGLAVLVAGLEIAQLWLPKRVFDRHDIAAGWLGVVLASAPWLIATFTMRRRAPVPASAVD